MTNSHDVDSNAAPEVQKETDPQPKAVWRFFVYSGIGIFAFFVPFQIGEKNTILLDHIVGWIQDGLGSGTRYVVLVLITAGAVFQIATGKWKLGIARAIFAALSVTSRRFMRDADFRLWS